MNSSGDMLMCVVPSRRSFCSQVQVENTAQTVKKWLEEQVLICLPTSSEKNELHLRYFLLKLQDYSHCCWYSPYFYKRLLQRNLTISGSIHVLHLGIQAIQMKIERQVQLQPQILGRHWDLCHRNHPCLLQIF